MLPDALSSAATRWYPNLLAGGPPQGCARGDRINVRYSARLTVDGTWPMRTELAADLKKARTLSLPLLYLSGAVEMFQR